MNATTESNPRRDGGTSRRSQQKLVLVDDLQTARATLQRHYEKATDGWQSSELKFARNVVQDTIKYLEGRK